MAPPYILGKRSRRNLVTCDIKLITLADEVIKYINYSVITGHRYRDDQMVAYSLGKSTKKWPFSKHNKMPSEALDFIPYPLKRYPDPTGDPKQFVKELARWYMVGAVFEACAKRLCINIRWGGDWNRDGSILDNKFDDLGHIELI